MWPVDSQDPDIPRLLIQGVGSSAWQKKHGYFNERFFMATLMPSRLCTTPATYNVSCVFTDIGYLCNPKTFIPKN
jgi:hypothetical protein